MTLDAALVKVTSEIDGALEQRLVNLELRCFADGLDFESIAGVVAEQRAVYSVWRVAAIQQVREWLLAECCGVE